MPEGANVDYAQPEAAKLLVDWAVSNRGQAVYQTQPLLLYGSLRNDAPPMATGGRGTRLARRALG